MNLTIKRLLPVVILPVALVGMSAAAQSYRANNAGVTSTSRIVSASDDVTDRDAPLVPRNRQDIEFYSARTQGEAETKVFVENRNGQKQLVYVDQEPGELVDVSADGSHGVFRRFVSPEKSVSYTVDFGKRLGAG